MMPGAKLAETLLERRGERLIGGRGAGEQRIAEGDAVACWHFEHIENRGARRGRVVRHVGVPALSGIGRAERAAIGFPLVGQDVDMREIRGMERARDVGLELAEALAEGDQRHLVETLIGDGDYRMMMEG